MKKTLLVLVFVASLFATDIFAQNNNSIKFAPVEMVRGAIGITYERALPNNTSFVLTARRTDFSRIDNNNLTIFSFIGILAGEQYTQKGFDAEISFRKYFGGNAVLNGFYLQPGIGMGNYRVTYAEEVVNFLGIDTSTKKIEFSEQLNVSSFVLHSGYQWAFASGFTLDMGIGIRANKTFSKTDNLPDNERLNGIKPMGNLKLGFAF